MGGVKYIITQGPDVLLAAAGRIEKPEKALNEIGLVLLRSISKTFKESGRPSAWKASKRAAAGLGKTLIKTARLMRSVTMQVLGGTLEVGTNVVYARIHQLGGKILQNVTVKQHARIMIQAFGKPIVGRKVMVKSHQRRMNLTIPARPYLVVQDADMRVFERIGRDYVTGAA